MKKAKEMIQKFRRDFAAKMELEEGSEVYALNLQFFPLTQIEGVNS
jgi:hypothetical protein